MDAENTNARAVRYAKRQKRDDEAGPSGIPAVDTPNPAEAAAAVEQTGDVFKLDIDCFEESFDYLPINDLVNVGKTCKRLQQVAGYCFQQNYLGRVDFVSNRIIIGFVRLEPLSFNLIPFVQRLMIHRVGYQYFLSVCSKFRRLKGIHCLDLDAVQMNCIKKMSMDEMEVLNFRKCGLGNNFYKFISKCTKLRRLIVKWCECEYNWFNRKYPTLEYFKLEPQPIMNDESSTDSMKGIAMFLEINPTVRKFATTAELLWEYRNEFVSANVKLDDLAILMEAQTDDQWQSTFDLLNTLHDHGIYNKLQIYIEDMLNQSDVNRLDSLNGLNKLGLLGSRYNALDLSAFKNIEELYLDADMSISNCEMLSTALINLKRIHFLFASIDTIEPFIRRSVKIQRIKITILKPGVYFNEDTRIIDLRALNREREQLPNAKKITLFVAEKIYLATKWALGDTDFSLIRLKRETSFDWFHDFYNLTDFS